LNTKNSNNKLITNLLISIFSGIYQFEKELLIERTKEGMYRAKMQNILEDQKVLRIKL